MISTLLHRPTCSVGFYLNRYLFCGVLYSLLRVSLMFSWPLVTHRLLFCFLIICFDQTSRVCKQKKEELRKDEDVVHVRGFSSPSGVSEVWPGVSSGEMYCHAQLYIQGGTKYQYGNFFVILPLEIQYSIHRSQILILIICHRSKWIRTM